MKKLFGGASASNQTAASLSVQETLDDEQNSMMSAQALPFVASQLSDAQKRGLAGLFACLLPDAHDGSSDHEWSKQFLALLVEHFLALPHSQVDAFLPMLTRQHEAKTERSAAKTAAVDDDAPALDPAPFLDLLVPVDSTSSSSSGLRALFKRKPKDETRSGNQTSSSSTNASSSPRRAATDAFRRDVLKQQLWFTVKATGYDARTRVLMRRLADAMAIPWRVVTLEEVAIGRALFAEATALPLEKRAATPSVWDWKRNAVIGAAAVTGGALLALTGGLAAPAIAGGLTALGGAGAVIGTAVVSSTGITATTILFGTAGAGVVGMKTDARMRSVQDFHFDLVSSGDGMNVYICVSGWLDDDDDPAGAAGFRRPWGDSREYVRAFYRSTNPEKVAHVDQVLDRYRGREDAFFAILRETYAIAQSDSVAATDETMSDPLQMLPASRAASYATGNALGPNSPETMRAWRWRDRVHQGDQYVLVWDEALLRRFGKSMRSFAKEQVMAYANTEIVKHTALATLFAAVAVPRAILKLADMIDNVWVLTMNAADAAGKLLAQSLQRREQGLRPVTLVGYGMGARLIFACLRELGKTPDASCGIVENAVLLGSPVPGANSDWLTARRVVAGRLINGYSQNDWMLGVMYRYQGWSLHSAGIAAINVSGVENVDLSAVIQGHMEYKNKVGVILDLLNLDS